LRETGGTHVDVELREASPAFLEGVERRGAKLLSALGSHYRLQFPSTDEPVDGRPPVGRLLFQVARESGAQLRGFRSAQRSLEEIFLEAVE
jgi:hypothetical protein